ncbi:MAG: UDP-N-acetylmuramate dehydrogenase [Actinobacteria bacterium]|nr:UDP-N-acetylmuramate dehydrogenase [Actinomycetota bacterium]
MADLSDYTSLRVGGPAKKFVEVSSEAEIIAAIEAAGDSPILIMGGGTNILVSDSGFAGTVIHISNNSLKSEVDACSGATLTIGAGENWDEFVAMTIERGFAYITRVRTYDRIAKGLKTFTNSECEFSYRNSHFKAHPGRYVVLDVQFQLRLGEMTTPIMYAELAAKLGIAVGDKASVVATRAAVLELRGMKGMLLSKTDHDSWSAGSFFTNPIVTKEIADALPADAPRWPTEDGKVKTSAAWLIEHSGIHKGDEIGGARISSKHVLALSNSGSATASDIAALAKRARDHVQKKFGITLVTEVNLIGLEI